MGQDLQDRLDAIIYGLRHLNDRVDEISLRLYKFNNRLEKQEYTNDLLERISSTLNSIESELLARRIMKALKYGDLVKPTLNENEAGDEAPVSELDKNE